MLGWRWHIFPCATSVLADEPQLGACDPVLEPWGLPSRRGIAEAHASMAHLQQQALRQTNLMLYLRFRKQTQGSKCKIQSFSASSQALSL